MIPEENSFPVAKWMSTAGVLQKLAGGAATKEIAAELGVSDRTAETHRRNIMERPDMHSVAELTKYVIRTGLTSLD